MKVFIAIAATAVLSAGTAYADCSYPTPPDHLPDGNTATLQEMVEAQKAVKEVVDRPAKSARKPAARKAAPSKARPSKAAAKKAPAKKTATKARKTG